MLSTKSRHATPLTTPPLLKRRFLSARWRHLPVLILLAFLATGCGAAEAPDPHEELMKGAALVAPDDANGIRVVYLSGGPYQMGYQHGVLLRSEIADLIAAAEADFVWSTFIDVVDEWGPGDGLSYLEHARANASPAVLEECRGLADGAEHVVTVDQCLMLSAITYFVEDLIPRYFPGIEGILGCSSFIADGAATAEGDMLHGRNLDYLSMPPMRENTIVFVRQPTGGARHVSFAWPGQVSVLTGMNEHGLTIGVHENSCPSESFRDLTGMPALHQAAAMMATAHDLDEALDMVTSTEQGTCQMFILSHAPSHDGAVVEVHGRGFGVRAIDDAPTPDVVFATNHFLHPDAVESQQPRAIDDLTDNSVARFVRLSERLTGSSMAPHPDMSPEAKDMMLGRIDRDAAIDILRDPVDLRPDEERRAYPCSTTDGSWAVGNNHNIHSAVMFGGRREVWLAAGIDEECGNAVYNPYVGFDVGALLTGHAEEAVIATVDPPYNAELGTGMHE
jgi:hypothetical protein